jgi:hypothetical protein
VKRAHAVPRRERRVLLKAAAGTLALLALPRAWARLPLLKGTELDAVALGYVADAAGLDSLVQPAYTPGSRCARCYFFQGRDSADAAPCTVFAGYRVPATGWCREFSPRT